MKEYPLNFTVVCKRSISPAIRGFSCSLKGIDSWLLFEENIIFSKFIMKVSQNINWGGLLF